MDSALVREISLKQKATLQTLAKNEETIGRYYQAMSRRFDDYKDIWNHFALQEFEHQRIFEEIAELLVKDRISMYGLEGFGEIATTKTTDIIEGLIDRIENNDLSMDICISMAVSIERSLAEAKFFHQVTCSDSKMNEHLKAVAVETETHHMQLDALLSALVDGLTPDKAEKIMTDLATEGRKYDRFLECSSSLPGNAPANAFEHKTTFLGQ